jgi:hypothetical protein
VQGFDRYLARDYDGAALWYLKAWFLGYEVGPANAGYLTDKNLASIRTLPSPMGSRVYEGVRARI